jgi:hypothetical protein
VIATSTRRCTRFIRSIYSLGKHLRRVCKSARLNHVEFLEQHHGQECLSPKAELGVATKGTVTYRPRTSATAQRAAFETTVDKSRVVYGHDFVNKVFTIENVFHSDPIICAHGGVMPRCLRQGLSLSCLDTAFYQPLSLTLAPCGTCASWRASASLGRQWTGRGGFRCSSRSKI